MPPSPLLIMAAPNGARKTKDDHPNLPITIEDVISEAAACHRAGAAMLHAHVRDDNARHSLDTGRYRELLSEMKNRLPDMLCQITTEQAGVFSPQEQARCLRETRADYASVAIREITGDQSEKAIGFGAEVLAEASAAGTKLQYILYSLDDLALLQQLHKKEMLPDAAIDVLYVLGRYDPNQRSHPDELDPFITADRSFIRNWMVCAFGPMEYDVMVKVAAHGGQARIGFENNLWLKDGSLAESTAMLVSQLATDFTPLTSAEARAVFA